MHQHVIDVVEVIAKSFTSPEAYRNKYEEIINDLIPNLNQQIKAYEHNGKATIRREILQSVMSMIDFKTLADKFRGDIKTKRPANISQSPAIPMLKFTIGSIDTDAFVDVYNEIDEPKEFKKGIKLCLNELHDIVAKVHEFENKLVDYRTNTISKLNLIIDLLYEHHYNFATNFKSITTPTYDFVISNRNISIPTSNKAQKVFITETYKQLVDNL